MRRLLLTAAAAIGFATTGLGPALAQEGAPAGTLRIALREDADMLDPTLARTYVGRIVFAGLCDKLFDINDKLGIVPQLSTGYEWTDSKTLVLKLRPNVLFQDGTPMDAAAVKYTFDRNQTMQASARRGEISAVDHVEIVAPTTVRVVLKAPSAPLLATLTDRAGMIVSAKAAAAEGKDFALHPVCAGPFSFVSRVPQSTITLERFPQYWNAPAIHFARVTYTPMVDSTARLAALQAGAIDLSEQVLPTDVATVQQDKKLRIVMSDNLGYAVIDMNVGRGKPQNTPLSKDARVRKAFELSLDRTAMIQVVYAGMFSPTAQPIPPSSPYFDQAVQPPARDIAKAKALLAQAAVKTPVSVELMLANNPDTQQLGVVIQSMASEAGFDVKLRTTEFATALDTADRGDYQMFLEGWSGRPDPDGNTWNFLHTGGPLDYSGYSNASVDADLDGAREVTEVAARKAFYDKMTAQVAADLPELYLYVPKNIVGMSARLKGFDPVPDGMIRVQNLTMAP